MAQAKLELLLELKNRLKAGLSTAKNSVLTSMKDMKGKLSEFTASNMQAFKGIADEIPGVGRALGLLANPYALAAAAALSFGAAAAKATNIALDWEKSMAKVNVTAQLGKSELSGLSTQLRFVGSQMSGDFMQVPETFNTIISAVGDVDLALQFLVPTLKASKAGFTDAKLVAEAATGVMASSGESINVTFDTLFATLNKGKAEFKDIAQYLPKIIPGARLAGAELYETAGAFAFLTAKGATAEQSTTGLMNMFKALSDPRFTDGFKAIGVNIFDDGKFRGILPIVTDLKKRMAGLNDEQAGLLIKTIGLDQEAKGAFSSMIQDVGKLKEIVDFVKNSTGQLDEAFKNSATSTGPWSEGWNKVMFFAVEFGNLFLPIIDSIGDGFNHAMKQSQMLFIVSKATFSGLIGAAKEFAKILMPIAEAMVNWRDPAAMVAALGKIPGVWDSMDVTGAFDKQFKRVIKENSMPGVGDAIPALNSSSSGNFEGDFEGSGAASNSASAPSAHQSKSIMITVNNDNKYNISQNTNGLSKEDFRRELEEQFLQMIRNVEASY
jgi:TP901 family phage tail tape measure protein